MPLDREGLFEVTIRVWLDSSCGSTQTGVQSDIYSLGVTLQTVPTGKDLSEPIFGYASPYAQDKEVSAELKLLLLQMLDAGESQRLASLETVKLALQDECLSKGQWQKTYKAMPFVAALTDAPRLHGKGSSTSMRR